MVADYMYSESGLSIQITSALPAGMAWPWRVIGSRDFADLCVYTYVYF